MYCGLKGGISIDANYFDASVVFVIKFLILFILSLTIMCMLRGRFGRNCLFVGDLETSEIRSSLNIPVL